MMNRTLNVQEVAIAVTAQNHNHTLLTPDFLRYSGVVPSDLELARPPVLSNTTTQLIFKNGIRISAQANQIVFSEVLAGNDIADVNVAAIALKYIEALPQVNYQGIAINLIGHVPFEQTATAARDYIFDTLLTSGSWQKFGKEPVRASMRFTYNLEQARLDLEVTEVRVKRSENEVIPAVLFAAAFNHAIASPDQLELLVGLKQAIADWQHDLEVFKELVNFHFLQSGGDELRIMSTQSAMDVA
jgi:hypothetical protein